MSDTLAKIETSNVGLIWRNATDVAGAVRTFALDRCLNIQGKKYPPVEVWQAVANAFGCVASARDVKRAEVAEGETGGYVAIGEVRRVSDGVVIATGEGFLGDDEGMWSKRPVFARRAMAQTRAISRACRSAFAFIIPMIDANLQTTPYEEMEAAVGHVEAEQAPAKGSRTANIKATVSARVVKVQPAEQSEPPPPSEEFAPSPAQEVVEQIWPKQDTAKQLADSVLVPYGKSKGQPLSSVTVKDLMWLLDTARENVAKEDPKWHAKNEKWRDAVEAECSRRKIKL